MSEDYDSDCAAAIDWLRSLPADTRIGWNTHHFSTVWPFSKGWVDVFVPDLQEAVGWNWAWTVDQEDDPDHDEERDPFSLTAPFDAVLKLRTTDDMFGWDETNQTFVSGVDQVQLLLPNGEELMLDMNDDDDFWYWQRGAGVPVSHDDGSEWVHVPVWTPHAVSLALNGWVADRAARADISFVWDPEIPESEHVTRAKAIAAKIAAGDDVESYQLGDGIAATGEAMDFLLGLPHEAAVSVTEQLGEIKQQLDKLQQSE